MTDFVGHRLGLIDRRSNPIKAINEIRLDVILTSQTFHGFRPYFNHSNVSILYWYIFLYNHKYTSFLKIVYISCVWYLIKNVSNKFDWLSNWKKKLKKFPLINCFFSRFSIVKINIAFNESICMFYFKYKNWFVEESEWIFRIVCVFVCVCA